MSKDDEKNESKFTETFHFKFLLVVIVGTVLVTGLYYFISPYQNCLRDTGLSESWCIKRTDW